MATVGEVQKHLQKVGFQVTLDQKAIEKIGATVNRQQFARAVKKAQSDQGAKGWVAHILKRAGLILETDDQDSVPAENTSHFPDPVNKRGGGWERHAEDSGLVDRESAGNPQQVYGVSLGPDEHAYSGQGAPRDQVKVFGGKAALTWEADQTRRREPTVALDAALFEGGNQYDWANKIRVQFTPAELPSVTAVLLGIAPQVQIEGHGEGANKGVFVERQQGNFFVRVFRGSDKVRAVPMDPAYAFLVACLFLRRIQAGQRGLDGVAVTAALKGTFTIGVK